MDTKNQESFILSNPIIALTFKKRDYLTDDIVNIPLDESIFHFNAFLLD